VSIATDPNEGLSNTQRRTRNALVSAARELVADGNTPTVEEAAAHAGVSRTTAYRYFPNRTALLVAAYPEIRETSLLGADPSEDPAARLDEVIKRFLDVLLGSEPQQRAMLRHSLDPDSSADLPLRKGRAIGWIADALDPLRGDLSEAEVRSLAIAIRSATGIEALVWLRDVVGLSPEQAAELMRWSAGSLLHAALSAGPPPVVPG